MRLVLAGATGRMGTALLRRLPHEAGFELTGLSAHTPGASLSGKTVQATLAEALGAGADVVIDFSHASSAGEHAELCAQRKVALVLGSTGLSPREQARVAEASKAIPIVAAPNMSVAVNALFRVAGELSQVLGSAYDVEVLEIHHRMKRDAPSGTALRLAEVLAQAAAQRDAGSGTPAASFRMARVGQVGERPAGEIGVQSLRGGDVVGDHTVFFLGDGERLELTHRATSRDSFAQGAYRAARFVVGQAPGVYDMQDVLGFRRGGESSRPPGRS